MRWEGNRESDNVEDVRDGGGGGGGFGFGGGTIGIGAIVIALIGGLVFGVNPLTILSFLSGGGGPPPVHQQAPAHPPPANDQGANFVRTILASTEDVWGALFQKAGLTYHPPRLVLFRGATSTGCGAGQAAMGPFYCPADGKVYIDLSFYDVLRTRLGAPGEFAQAYVVAHEIGHHVQDELGITRKVDAARQRMSQAQANAVSVRVELQADCFAGVWGHYAEQQHHWMDPGDIESAMNAAAKIGDDALQRSAGRAVVPESFTHGTSAQRQRWFMTGFKTGSVKACDTFKSPDL